MLATKLNSYMKSIHCLDVEGRDRISWTETIAHNFDWNTVRAIACSWCAYYAEIQMPAMKKNGKSVCNFPFWGRRLRRQSSPSYSNANGNLWVGVCSSVSLYMGLHSFKYALLKFNTKTHFFHCSTFDECHFVSSYILSHFRTIRQIIKFKCDSKRSKFNNKSNRIKWHPGRRKSDSKHIVCRHLKSE